MAGRQTEEAPAGGQGESSGAEGGPAPRSDVRRFDVFAEYNRIENERKGMSAARAKGHALWVAKVVAARRFGRSGALAAVHDAPGRGHDGEGGEPREQPDFPIIGGQPQTDALFDREVVRRLGADFYHRVFTPAIEQAIDEGRRYEDIRDVLRKPWNARRRAAA